MARYDQEESAFEEKLITINRTAKVVKGGRRFHMTALVVVGDRNGNVGIGYGKASEVAGAINKAGEKARKNVVKVAMVGSTVPHEIIGKADSAEVLFKPAKEGTGIIAGGPVRSILELAGYRDVRAKSIGRTTNTLNIVYAAMNALENLKTIEDIQALRTAEVK